MIFNRKLKEIKNIVACGLKYEWPECEPIDKSDKYWETNNNMECNGIAYHKVEYESGRWRWELNREVMRYKAEHQANRDRLLNDLQTKVISEEEMQKVLAYGPNLFTREMVPYREEDIQKRFNEAICQQHRLRKIYGESKWPKT